jgi:hypothetical protein
MVLRNLSDQTNRALADIVLYARNGLVTVEYNKVGPHGITLPIDQVYLQSLITLQNFYPKRGPYCGRDIYHQFVGEHITKDYNPWHLDPPYIRRVEPPDE